MRLLLIVFALLFNSSTQARTSEESARPPESPQQGAPVYKEKPASRGLLLYTNHCSACHDSLVHIRARRKAASKQEIYAWVVRWSQQLKLQWNQTDIEDVVRHLNQRYYQYSE